MRDDGCEIAILDLVDIYQAVPDYELIQLSLTISVFGCIDNMFNL